jgi:hypothetical protein
MRRASAKPNPFLRTRHEEGRLVGPAQIQMIANDAFEKLAACARADVTLLLVGLRRSFVSPLA